MAPAARDAEIAALVAPSSDSDTRSSWGSTRKYAAAFAMFALVVVIVGGIGMYPHASVNEEVGDIIEACADYTVESTCSAASCNWDGVKCNVGKGAVRGPMKISTEREAATTGPNCPSEENATADLAAQFTSAIANKSNAEIKVQCQTFLQTCSSEEDQTFLNDRNDSNCSTANDNNEVDGFIHGSLSQAVEAGAEMVNVSDITGYTVGQMIKFESAATGRRLLVDAGGEWAKVGSVHGKNGRRLSEDGRRLAGANPGYVGFSPALQNSYPAFSTTSVVNRSTYEYLWWAAHGSKYAQAGPAFPAAEVSAKKALELLR